MKGTKRGAALILSLAMLVSTGGVSTLAEHVSEQTALEHVLESNNLHRSAEAEPETAEIPLDQTVRAEVKQRQPQMVSSGTEEGQAEATGGEAETEMPSKRSARESMGFTYTVDSQSEVTITGYTGIDGYAVIPETLEGCPVTKIADQAFKDNKTIKEITFPSTLKSIGYSAFQNCKNLLRTVFTESTLNGYTATIGDYAFQGDISLSQVEFSKNVTSIGDYAYDGCAALESVLLPSGLTSIGYYAFCGTYLRSVMIPKSVITCDYSVGYGNYNCNGPFAGAEQLETVSFEEGMKIIPAYVLASGEYKSAVKNIQIPKTVTAVGDYAFMGCASLQGDLGKQLPETITTLGNYSFYGCKGVKSLTLGKQIQTIGEYAFAACDLLGEITFPSTLKSIGYRAFQNCKNLIRTVFTESTLNGYTATIGDYAFQGDISLSQVEFSKNVTSIGDYAYDGCVELETITLPSGLTSIGYYAFCGTYLRSVMIPKSVITCDYSVGYGNYNCNGPFAGAEQLETVSFEEGMKIIPAYVLASGEYKSAVKNIQIPDTVTTIGDYAFMGCASLQGDLGKQLPETITTLGNYSFYGCKGVKSLTLGKQIQTIGEYAFAACDLLGEITFPSTLKSIGYRAFQNCKNLIRTVFTESTLNGYTATIGDYAFQGDISLSQVEFSKNVTSIGDYAYDGCVELETITLPSGLTSIGYYAFCGTYLRSVMIPKSVITCDYSVGYGNYNCNGPFAGAEQLETVSFEEGMKIIPAYVLASGEYKSAVKNIQIPKTVTAVGDYAFRGCAAEEVQFPASLQSIGSYAFYGCPELTDTVFADNTVPRYELSIGENAFRACAKLSRIAFSSNVTAIGYYAYGECIALQSVTLPENLKVLGAYAFSGTNIAEITIPKTLEKCENSNSNGAFSGVSQLETVTFEQGMRTIPAYVLASNDYVSYIKKVIVPDTVTAIEDYAFYKCDNMTLCGYTNSYGEIYANRNNIPFESIGTAREKYTITSSCQTGGTITPKGSITAFEGEDLKFTIVPQSGYIIDDVQVDGESVGAVETYTLEEISADHKIEAFFMKDPSKEKKTQTLTGTASYQKKTTDEAFQLDTKRTVGDGALSYKSSNTSVASVDKNGTVTLKGAGTAVITVTAAETESYKKAVKEVTITVQKPEKKAQKLTGTTSYTKTAGDASFKLDAKRTEGDGKLSYSSGNTSVVRVDSAGTVTIVGAGKAEVTVTAAETESYTAAELRVSITVEQKDDADDDKDPDDSDDVDDSEIPDDGKKPDNTEDVDDNEDVDDSEIPDDGKKPGNTETPDDGGKPNQDQKITKISLNQTKLMLEKGTSVTLKAVVTPQNAVDKKLLWKSSNTKVAKVSSSGKITAKTNGTAVITAVAKDGSGVKASCKVTVPYKIVYRLNKGKNNSKNVSSYYNQKVTLKNPSRKGYVFKGWYTDSKYKKKITTIKKGTKKDYTLYAKWAKVSVKKTSVISAKNKKKGQLLLNFKKISGSKGYEISYSTDKNFKKSVKKKTAAQNSVLIKGLKKGKTYYVRVRAYKQDSAGKKVYGSYSNPKKVKIIK